MRNMCGVFIQIRMTRTSDMVLVAIWKRPLNRDSLLRPQVAKTSGAKTARPIMSRKLRVAEERRVMNMQHGEISAKSLTIAEI